MRSQKGGHHCPNDNSAHQVRSRLRRYQLIQSCCLQFQQPKALVSGSWRKLATKKFAVRSIGEFACIQGQFGDNHKVKLGKNRSKTNGVKLSKMASGLWVSLRYLRYFTSNLSWPGVGSDRRCRWMHFSAAIEQNLMGSARLTEANP